MISVYTRNENVWRDARSRFFWKGLKGSSARGEKRRRKKKLWKGFHCHPDTVVGVVISKNECGTENAKNESRQQSDVELVKLQSFFIGWKREPQQRKEEREKGKWKILECSFALCYSIKVGDGAYHDFTMRGNVCDDGDGRAAEMSLNFSAISTFFLLSVFICFEKLKFYENDLKLAQGKLKTARGKTWSFPPLFCVTFLCTREIARIPDSMKSQLYFADGKNSTVLKSQKGRRKFLVENW